MAKSVRKSAKPKVVSPPVIPEIPVKVTIEVIIRQEAPLTPPRSRFQLAEAIGGGCPENKFTYAFDKENASVLSLIVEEFEKDSPGDSGEFTTCINDASPEPKVRVIGLAKENLPGG